MSLDEAVNDHLPSNIAANLGSTSIKHQSVAEVDVLSKSQVFVIFMTDKAGVWRYSEFIGETRVTKFTKNVYIYIYVNIYIYIYIHIYMSWLMTNPRWSTFYDMALIILGMWSWRDLYTSMGEKANCKQNCILGHFLVICIQLMAGAWSLLEPLLQQINCKNEFHKSTRWFSTLEFAFTRGQLGSTYPIVKNRNVVT